MGNRKRAMYAETYDGKRTLIGFRKVGWREAFVDWATKRSPLISVLVSISALTVSVIALATK